MTQVLVITGASRGIGAATARKAASAGYAVAVNYAASPQAAQAVVNDITTNGGRAVAIQGDISDPHQAATLFQRAEAELGPVTALFNNAGTTGPIRRVTDLDPADLRRTFEVNVFGSFYCAREAVTRMATSRGGSGGVIVNMSSRAAQLSGANEWVHYGASKGAIDTLTSGLAKEVAGDGIRVNAVAPGLIDTEIHERAGAPDRVDRLLPGVPMARVGSADEVADVVMWLLGPTSSYVTGVTVDISGGR